MYWNMDEKGPDRPARKIQKRKREPSGVRVKPGTYKLVLSSKSFKDSTEITVATDPRLDVSSSAIEEVYTTSKEIEAMIQVSADAVKQLVESKNIAQDFSKKLAKLDKEKYQAQIDSTKSLIKEIDSLVALFIGKEDKRQGITRNPEMTVARRLQIAYGYSRSRKTGITETERRLIAFAEDELNSALDRTNSFFEENWKEYRRTMESLDVSPFKETTKFSLID